MWLHKDLILEKVLILLRQVGKGHTGRALATVSTRFDELETAITPELDNTVIYS